MAKNKTIMVQCKNCKYFTQRSEENGICAYDQGLLNKDWDRNCNSFKNKVL